MAADYQEVTKAVFSFPAQPNRNSWNYKKSAPKMREILGAVVSYLLFVVQGVYLSEITYFLKGLRKVHPSFQREQP